MSNEPRGARNKITGAQAMNYAGAANSSSRVSTPAFVAGLLCILVAVTMTSVLVLHHFGGLSLPGCGRDGGCEQAAKSYWGKIPGTTWPISFMGFAYFLSLLAAWPFARNGVSPMLRNIIRLGVLISLFYVGVLIVQQHLCLYCLGTHGANVLFWIVVELSSRRQTGSMQPIVAMIAVFVLASGILFVTEQRENRNVNAKADADRAESVAEILKETEKKKLELEQNKNKDAQAAAMNSSEAIKKNDTSPTKTTEATTKPDQTNTTVAKAAEKTTKPEDSHPWTGGFTGRYLLGPKEAKVRVVMISDYQCSDCNRIEPEVMQAVEQNKDSVSLSMKHFPMCKDCNRFFADHSLHSNACWAARAAETAGILGGNDGFWKMHKWLFEHAGTFTDPGLRKSLLEMGFDPQQFVNVMMSDQTLPGIKADIEEADWLGLFYTPMVFINGVELKGVFSPNAVPNAIKQILAQNPPAMNCDLDQPPPAIHRFITDWLEQPLRQLPMDRSSWFTGPASAKATIVIWGDYQEPYTAEADKYIREFMKNRSDVRYDFRHYPIDTSCNNQAQTNMHPTACRAARAAEAAGRIGGVDAYWKMHVWLFEHQKNFSEESLRQAVAEMGIDLGQFFEMMERPEVEQAIKEDLNAAKQLGLTSIPFIFMNGKYVPRWRREGDIFIRMMKIAAGEPDPILSKK